MGLSLIQAMLELRRVIQSIKLRSRGAAKDGWSLSGYRFRGRSTWTPIFLAMSLPFHSVLNFLRVITAGGAVRELAAVFCKSI